MAIPAVGERAPDFDLTSTEGCVLTLRDSVGRAAALLYFFADPEAEAAHSDLLALARLSGRLPGPLRALGVSPTPVPRLQELQRELRLPYPLLRDDRALASRYGFDAEAGL
ncbi:MAG: peroxiredoxin family protein, partial [Thermoanaerobaculia bacterium]